MKTRKETRKMNDKEKLNELSEIVEEQAYIVKRCSDNLTILAGDILRYSETSSNAIEAVGTLLEVVHSTLLNHVWPTICEIKSEDIKS